ncbi:MAG: hypothetical protein A2161_14655 [Candidatus Schekmanbacteria bacterium RBG_13_48_7]|uniref:WWE domain-containing protein n=1 Tax=Candidatus Schekmanbacteria bacterium RBG_13_48_7 TaxID=1817878 RepID=A0A1F7RV34_9BACT|nr:MAG: hypothetical protein A2161_14655 [Candidatus Schekmanbacteria bacterium RBG_13_48_7]
MIEKACAACTFRSRYDNNPKSILGRLWRWHINWCPGWKKYIRSLNDIDRKQIEEQYAKKKKD